jgi:hypothetical protein
MGENHCSNEVFGVILSMHESFLMDLDGLPPDLIHYKGLFYAENEIIEHFEYF